MMQRMRQNSAMARPPKNPRPVVDEPSKTQLKKDMHALQALGEELTTLGNDQLDQLNLPESLRDALEELQRVGKHEATRRHMQFIGKLMRDVDPAPIRAQIDRWEMGTRANKAAFKASERWRDRLIAEPDALSGFLTEQPEVDGTALAVLLAKARLQAARGEAPAASRQVFRVIYRAMTKLKIDETGAGSA
jgi:ribosome-associated protein